ncbi:MAG: hypothetical protein ACR2PH_03680 [Desulfobulbia bacterium]
MDNALPIKPEDVDKIKSEHIPDEVIEVFNILIVENWDGSASVVNQDDAVLRIRDELGIDSDQAFDYCYLEIEHIFSNAGWNVEYNKPAYNESHRPYFAFTKK